LTQSLVAVVEDDQSLLEALESLLESAGYAVLLFRSAEELLISRRLGEIDCLISDIGLPGINGIELLRAVRGSRAQLPVIIITALSDPGHVEAALSAGALHVFVKPIDNAALLSAIAGAS
jgi:FixJ family two-component response regulator